MKNYLLIFVLFLFTSCMRSALPHRVNVNNEEVEVYNDLNKALNNRDKVMALNLSDQGLEEIPTEIYKLRGLRYLNLSHNSIKAVPDSIMVLDKLLTLVLAYNELEVISSEIKELKCLKNLILLNNKLSTLPDSINKLQHLERLVLMNNDFDFWQILKIRKLLPTTSVIAYLEER